jgi:hypothetical protein
VITATTEVVISLKSKLELASLDLSGIAVSRMSMMRMADYSLEVGVPRMLRSMKR